MKKLSKEQIIGMVAVLIIIYFVWKKRKNDNEQTEINNGTLPTGTINPGTTSPAWEKRFNALPSVGADTILKKGMKAKEIWTIQFLYNDKIAKKEGKSTISVDGIFGSQTETAVKYVLNNKYNFTRLNTWKDWVEMSKAERTAKLNAQTNPEPLTVPTLMVNPSESTFVYNPYN